MTEDTLQVRLDLYDASCSHLGGDFKGREILRTRLFPPPEEAESQALPPNNLAQGPEYLDPYAKHYQAENSSEKILPQNQLPGIGAQFFERNGQVLLSHFARGPLPQAEVSECAVLLEINDHSVQGRDLHEVAAMFRGEPESLLQLRLRPLSADSAKTVDVVRSSFRPLDVELIQTAQQPVFRIRDFEFTLSDGSVLRQECTAGGLEPDLVVSKSRLYDLEHIVAQA